MNGAGEYGQAETGDVRPIANSTVDDDRLQTAPRHLLGAHAAQHRLRHVATGVDHHHVTGLHEIHPLTGHEVVAPMNLHRQGWADRPLDRREQRPDGRIDDTEAVHRVSEVGDVAIGEDAEQALIDRLWSSEDPQAYIRCVWHVIPRGLVRFIAAKVVAG
jgi:hypothetical protein